MFSFRGEGMGKFPVRKKDATARETRKIDASALCIKEESQETGLKEKQVLGR